MADLDQDQKDLVEEAVANIMMFGDPGDMTSDGSPKVSAIEETVGFDISAADRDKAFAEWSDQERPDEVGEDEADEVVAGPRESFEEFVWAKQGSENKGGMFGKHHPDIHYIGADANSCPKCDSTLPSLREQFDAAQAN